MNLAARPSSIAASQPPGLREATILSRVGRVLQDIAAERVLDDDEIRQHAADCTDLMEAAHARYQASGIGADREEAVLWMHRRDEALRIFSRRGATYVDLGR